MIMKETKHKDARMFWHMLWQRLEFTYGTRVASGLYLFVQVDSSSTGLSVESDHRPKPRYLGTGLSVHFRSL